MEKIEVNSLGEITKLLRFKTLEGYIQIIINTISYCKSCTSKPMTFIYAGGNSYPPVCATIKKVEKVLNESYFIRCHRSFLINVNKVECFTSRKRRILMQSGEQIPISKSKWETIRNQLLNMQIPDKKINIPPIH
jgi:DNA-binding LytR/AlgR family response regulator